MLTHPLAGLDQHCDHENNKQHSAVYINTEKEKLGIFNALSTICNVQWVCPDFMVS